MEGRREGGEEGEVRGGRRGAPVGSSHTAGKLASFSPETEGSRTRAARRRTNGESHHQRAHPHAGRQTEGGWRGEKRRQKSPEKVREESAAQPRGTKERREEKKNGRKKRDGRGATRTIVTLCKLNVGGGGGGGGAHADTHTHTH